MNRISFLVSDEDKALIGGPVIKTISQAFVEHFQLPSCSVEVWLTDTRTIKALNDRYRKRLEPTDVLSFQLFQSLEEIQNLSAVGAPLLGSIAICPEKASEYGETLPHLVHHGLLHLLGFDHEVDKEAWLKEEYTLLKNLEKQGVSLLGIPL